MDEEHEVDLGGVRVDYVAVKVRRLPHRPAGDGRCGNASVVYTQFAFGLLVHPLLSVLVT